MTKDYRITVKVRNNRILKAIEDSGGTPGGKWCRANGLGYARIVNLINMTSSPISEDGTLYPDAQRLCDVLNKLPEDLWSNEQLYPLEKNFSEMEMDYEQVMALLPSSETTYLFDDSALEQEQTRGLLSQALGHLNKQQQEVMRLRFVEDKTLEQCAEEMGVTRERIRQIEAKALRTLRKPHVLGIYADTTDLPNDVKKDAKAARAKSLTYRDDHVW